MAIDPTSPGSDLVAVCLDPRFKQAKFLESPFLSLLNNDVSGKVWPRLLTTQ